MSDDLFDIVGGAPSDEQGTATIALRVHVQPGAGRSQVVGRHGDALHVRVAPPPADGRANVAVQELLAEFLGVAKAAVELSSGEHAREKRFKITGVVPAEMRRRIAEAVDDATSSLGKGRRDRQPRR